MKTTNNRQSTAPYDFDSVSDTARLEFHLSWEDLSSHRNAFRRARRCLSLDSGAWVLIDKIPAYWTLTLVALMTMMCMRAARSSLNSASCWRWLCLKVCWNFSEASRISLWLWAGWWGWIVAILRRWLARDTRPVDDAHGEWWNDRIHLWRCESAARVVEYRRDGVFFDIPDWDRLDRWKTLRAVLSCWRNSAEVARPRRMSSHRISAGCDIAFRCWVRSWRFWWDRPTWSWDETPIRQADVALAALQALSFSRERSNSFYRRVDSAFPSWDKRAWDRDAWLCI